jgi:periplasmic protein TonB
LCSNRYLTRALLFSVLAHTILISGFGNFPLLTAEDGQKTERQAASLAAHLRPLPVVAMSAAEPDVPAKSGVPPTKKMLSQSQSSPQPVVRAESTVANQPTVLASPAATPGAPETTIASVQAKPPPDASEARVVSAPEHADGIRQYRINLGREAKRFRRYPVLARERGWEGEVLVVVTTVAGISEPRVSLSRSSGRTVLDNEALAMLQQAVRTAQVPETLANRPFALDMPVRFSLEE